MSWCGMLPSTVQAGRLSFVEHLIRTWIEDWLDAVLGLSMKCRRSAIRCCSG